MLTLDELRQALPSNMRNIATQEYLDKINNIASDPEAAQYIRDNLVSYTSVLKDGKFKAEDYLNAVAYVSYKLMGFTNQESYKRAFPNRYAQLVANGADDKTISAYVAAYNKGKLVNLVLEQSLVPVWVLNQDVNQKAINKLVSLMSDANSEKVQCDAAIGLLTHLKRPEAAKVELSFGEAESSGMKELKDTLAQMAIQQQEMIRLGINTREIAHQSLTIEGEAKDVTPV